MWCPNPDCPDRELTGHPDEYVPGVSTCPVCGTTLVESEQEATGPVEEEELVAVHEVADMAEA